MRLFLLASFCLLGLFGCSSEPEQAPPQKKKERPVATFSDPTALAFADGAIFVAEREGFVYRLEGKKKTLWADVSARVGEGGLAGIAFSPGWERDGLFYLFLQNRGGAQVLFEGAEESEQGVVRRAVLRIEDLLARPGPLAWQENKLLLAVGGDRQRSSWSGSLLRIRPYLGEGQAYQVPDGNSEEEVWLRGLWDTSSIVFGNGKTWIVSNGRLLRTEDDKRGFVELERRDCIRGGALQGEDYLYGCGEEIFSWPEKAATDKTKKIDSLWAGPDGLWVISGGALWKI